ncbi:YraN family protein [Brevundimonas sp. SORGH_AS_0993]|uniref:YraN family protein n=1 Tax=Brevundimonas sp. SORGH_AS_0993 TaxID=3041794 RepID=UPI0027866CD0|nr:YraN family protein [Brevundimonas sp. SORGH_AS_0993]MDQ1154839.1 putative endonuclease [Brevundimonas sp. SORGH_AS_0993]
MKPPRLPRPAPAPRPKAAWRQAKGGAAFRRGHAAEWIAAALLMAKGYRILGFRLKDRAGEIDLLARRGRVLAVVEVKRRMTLDAARLALKPAQYDRLVAAGQAIRRKRPALQALDLRIDMVALAPGRFPRHLRGVERGD